MRYLFLCQSISKNVDIFLIRDEYQHQRLIYKVGLRTVHQNVEIMKIAIMLDDCGLLKWPSVGL